MSVIRLAILSDLDAIAAIVQRATLRMNDQGIHQWDDIYPSQDILKADIENRQMYVIEFNGIVAGLIVLNEIESPEYADIRWKYVGRFLVVHRLTIDPA
jgi:hypothetical protein